MSRLSVFALLALFSALIAQSAKAAEPATGPAYQLSVDFDVPFILITGGLASSFLFVKEGDAPGCAPLCDKSNLNWLDRQTAGFYNPTWDRAGNAAVLSTVVLVPIGLIAGEPSWTVLSDLVVVGEAALLTSAIQVTASYAVGRPRPRVYGEKAPLSDRDDADAARSFFSGHIANTLAVTMVTTRALRRLHRPDIAWITLAVGVAGSALVGVSRIEAGGHFPTDVIIGAAVGVGAGIAVPALHEARLALAPIVTGSASGVQFTGVF
jgi:membrane-associated phospholipid phosphatase